MTSQTLPVHCQQEPAAIIISASDIPGRNEEAGASSVGTSSGSGKPSSAARRRSRARAPAPGRDTAMMTGKNLTRRLKRLENRIMPAKEEPLAFEITYGFSCVLRLYSRKVF
jgi:hypothetical protein